MGAVGAVVAPEEATRCPRPTLAKHPGRSERRALDLAHGSTVERPCGPLSALSDLSSPIPTLGAGRNADAHPRGAGRRPAGPRGDRCFGTFHRRQLQRREKGGSAVGPTRRGKGTKTLAVADRHGLPVAVSIASASPHVFHADVATSCTATLTGRSRATASVSN